MGQIKNQIHFFTDATNSESRSATSGSGPSDFWAICRAVAGAVDAGRRVANVVLKPHDREKRQNCNVEKTFFGNSLSFFFKWWNVEKHKGEAVMLGNGSKAPQRCRMVRKCLRLGFKSFWHFIIFHKSKKKKIGIFLKFFFQLFNPCKTEPD